MSEEVHINEIAARKKLAAIRNVVLIGSGKGGVGKSFVASSLALAIAKRGLRVGILDLDIHGASIPIYFGVRPPLKTSSGGLEPKQAGPIKIMSTALLAGDRPTPVRGADKGNLITEFFALTNWGSLDYLMVDLPPGTGDEVLSAFALFGQNARMILVTTPSAGAVKIVSRLRKLAHSEKVQVEGTIVNMSFIVSGSSMTYPFGKVDLHSLERKLRSKILGVVPLYPKVNTTSLLNLFESRSTNEISKSFDKIADLIVSD